jgi:hypothetical protein
MSRDIVNTSSEVRDVSGTAGRDRGGGREALQERGRPHLRGSGGPGYTSWSAATRPRATPGCSHAHDGRSPAPARSLASWRTRSSRCASSSSAPAWMPARTPSPGTSSARVPHPRPPRPSGGSWSAVGSSRLSLANDPSPPTCGSKPTSPTNAGRPTPPTGSSPITPTSRSATSSTTTRGSRSPRSPAPASRPPTSSRCSPTRSRSTGYQRAC